MTSVPDDRCRKAAGGVPWRARRNRPLRPETADRGLPIRRGGAARVRHVAGAAAARRAKPQCGIAFASPGVVPGQAEHRGIL